jgi:hypothetical protein
VWPSHRSSGIAKLDCTNALRLHDVFGSTYYIKVYDLDGFSPAMVCKFIYKVVT